MLSTIVTMNTPQEFSRMSQRINNPQERKYLYSEIADAGYVLPADEMWTDEYLDSLVAHPSFVSRVLEETAKEAEPTCLLHRLQVLAHVNPGIRRYVNIYLQRACM